MRTVDDKVLEAFRLVAPTVEAFARINDLRIDRYQRGKPAWELRFARDRGGEAAILIGFREPEGHVLDIASVWWLDDFPSLTRRLRSEKIGTYYRRDGGAALERLLTEALARIDRWTEGDLGPPRGPYRDWPRLHTAESFAAERERLPRH
jgi:hypothetical protein